MPRPGIPPWASGGRTCRNHRVTLAWRVILEATTLQRIDCTQIGRMFEKCTAPPSSADMSFGRWTCLTCFHASGPNGPATWHTPAKHEAARRLLRFLSNRPVPRLNQKICARSSTNLEHRCWRNLTGIGAPPAATAAKRSPERHCWIDTK